MSVLYSYNMGRIGFKNAGAHAFRGFKQIQGIAKRGHKFLQGAPQHLRTLDEYAGKGAHLLGKAGHMQVLRVPCSATPDYRMPEVNLLKGRRVFRTCVNGGVR